MVKAESVHTAFSSYEELGGDCLGTKDVVTCYLQAMRPTATPGCVSNVSEAMASTRLTYVLEQNHGGQFR